VEVEMAMISWPAWGTTAHLSVGDPAALHAAQRLATAVLARAERAADQRNPHAELHRLDGSAGRPVRVGRRLAAMVAASLDAARRFGGLVDPTVGNATVRAAAGERLRNGAGLPTDFSWAPVCGGSPDLGPRPAIGWQAVDLDGRYVTVPAGVLLDLSAIGKAVTTRHCAELLADRLGVGVLVGLGGDLAAAGPAPAGGWQVDRSLEPLVDGDGVATVTRCVVDPRTGRVVPPAFARVTVRRDRIQGGVTAAKTLALAAAVIGDGAALWLDEHGAGSCARRLARPQRQLRPTG
jgi:thiamine biosynthesis lipoprotein